MLSRISLNVATKAITKSQLFTKNPATNRSLHLICQPRLISVPNFLNCKNNVSQNSIRYSSKVVVDSFEIPAAPIAPTIVTESLEVPQNLSELAQAGLGTAWTPVSLVEHALEALHVHGGLPWWGSIFTLAVCARLALLPVYIKSQQMANIVSAVMAEQRELQAKLSRARKARDRNAMEQYSLELDEHVRLKGTTPLKSLLLTGIQGVVAITCFISLSKMTAAPLQSMTEGGLAWFTNLCIPDPHQILPAISSLTLLLIIYTSANQIPMPPNVKKFMFAAIPVITYLCTKSFPAGVLVYWVTTNSITLLQMLLFRIQVIRDFFKIPMLTVPTPPSLFRGSTFNEIFRENMENYKVSQQFSERYQLKKVEERQKERNRIANVLRQNSKTAKKSKSL